MALLEQVPAAEWQGWARQARHQRLAAELAPSLLQQAAQPDQLRPVLV